MPGSSDLSELYEAVFGVPPLHSSQVVLRRMQEFLGLKREDAFSRMLIVQLRCADQIEETRQQLQIMLDGLAPLLVTARTLVHELERSSGDIARRNRRIPAMERAADMVEVGSRPFPLFAYLAYGFSRRRPYDDLHVGERRAAARYDLFMLSGVVVSLAMLLAGFLHRASLGLHL